MKNTDTTYKAPETFNTIDRGEPTSIKITALKLKKGKPDIQECGAWIVSHTDGKDFILAEPRSFFSRKRFTFEPGCRIEHEGQTYICIGTPIIHLHTIYQVLQTKAA